MSDEDIQRELDACMKRVLEAKYAESLGMDPDVEDDD